MWASTPFESVILDNGRVERRQSPRAYDAIGAKAGARLKLFDRRLGLRSENTVGAAVRKSLDEFAPQVRKQIL